MGNAVWAGLSLNSSYAEFSQFDRQVLALALATQCAALVQRLASTGEASESEIILSINPLISLNPDSFESVLPRVSDVSLGLQTLQQILADQQAGDANLITRYTLTMLHLRGRLLANDAMVEDLRSTLASLQRLEAAESSNEFRSEQLTDFCAVVAGLYQRSISRLKPRIQVKGRADYLKDEWRAQLIRTLLLSGIRAAVLWHQLGGRRWRLLFQRSKIQRAAAEIRRKALRIVH